MTSAIKMCQVQSWVWNVTAVKCWLWENLSTWIWTLPTAQYPLVPEMWQLILLAVTAITSVYLGEVAFFLPLFKLKANSMHWTMPQRTDSAVAWWDWQHEQSSQRLPGLPNPYGSVQLSWEQLKMDKQTHQRDGLWANLTLTDTRVGLSVLFFVFWTALSLKAMRQKHLLVTPHWPS